MKRIFAILLALLIAATMIACTEKEDTETNVNEPEADVETPAVDVEPETEVEGEVATDEEDVVIDVPAADPEEDVPAAETEEENVPAVMPEVTPEADTPAVEPEVEVETPAVEPEVEVEIEIDTPAAEPETETPDEEVVTEPEEAPEEAPAEGNIDELFMLADTLYAGINPEEMPMVGTMELTSENFEYSAFIPYKDSYLAVENMPMMGSQPHSVVIVKTASAEEAAQVAADMEANCNPRKWICVSARSVKSASKGNYAILVMTSVEVMPSDEIDEAAAEEMSNAKSDERAQLIIDNFLANA